MYVRRKSKNLGNHVVSSEEEKERLQWEGFVAVRQSRFHAGAEWGGTLQIVASLLPPKFSRPPNCDIRVE